MNNIEKIINYIEFDSEILIPIDRFFNEDGSHITKKKYGLILLEILCAELREKFPQKLLDKKDIEKVIDKELEKLNYDIDGHKTADFVDGFIRGYEYANNIRL